MSMKEHLLGLIRQGGQLIHDGNDLKRPITLTPEQFSPRANLIYRIAYQVDDIQEEYALKVIPPRPGRTFEGSPEQRLYQIVGRHDESHILAPFYYWQDPIDKLLYLFMPFINGQLFARLLRSITKAHPDQTRLGQERGVSFLVQMGYVFQSLRGANVLAHEQSDYHYLVTSEDQLYAFDFEQATNRVHESGKATREVVEHERKFFLQFEQLLVPPQEVSMFNSPLKLALTGWTPEQVAFYEAEFGTTQAAEVEKFEQLRERLQTNITDVELVWTAKLLSDRYGDEFGQFFMKNVKACYLDPSWSFVEFMEDVEDLLKADQEIDDDILAP